MNLIPGQQIQNQGQSLYEIDELLYQTETIACYSGFRRFLNYKFQDRQFYYAAKDEWSKVLLKIPVISDQASSGDVKNNSEKFEAEKFEYECKSVLSRHSRWFPQVLDFFELSENGPDNTEYSRSVPVLVHEYPYPEKLTELIRGDDLSLVDRVRLAVVLLDFFEALQNHGQFCFGVSLDEFRVGTHLRLQSVFQARISEIKNPVDVIHQTKHLFLAPELKQIPLKVTESTDIYHWAILAALIVGGEKAENELNGEKDRIVFSKSLLGEIRQEFMNASESAELILRPLSPQHYQKKATQMVKGLGILILSCLNSNPQKRPQSFQELRKKASQSASGGIRKILNPFS